MGGLQTHLLTVGLTVGWLLVPACNRSVETREASTGGPLETDPHSPGGTTAGGTDDSGTTTGGDTAGTADSDAIGDTAGDDTGGSDDGTTDSIGEGDGETGDQQLTGETIETCTAQNKNWIAVVNSGNDPPACGETLTDYCCSRAEIKARFPAFAAQLETRFAEAIDDERYVLYHCSTNGAGTASELKHTFHLAKMVNGSTCYKTYFVTGLAPAATGAGGTCPEQVQTSDLTVDAPPCDGSDTTTTLSFTDDIMPIIATSCSGTACHDADSTAADTSLQFLDDETAFVAKKTEIKSQLSADSMPPTGSGKTLSTSDETKIVNFLNQ